MDLFDSPTVITRSWPKMYATLDGNKCFLTLLKQCHNDIMTAIGGPIKY